MHVTPFQGQCAQVHDRLAYDLCTRKQADKPLIVGINGIDGSGKTTMAAALERNLQSKRYDVCRISVDDFHNPRSVRYRKGELSPQAFYDDSIDFDAIALGALRPVFEAEIFPVRCQTKSFNLLLDEAETQHKYVQRNTIFIIEGIFLFRPEIVSYLHVKMFIRVTFEQILQRVLLRDQSKLGSELAIRNRYEQKYIPGQQLYFDLVSPESMADIIIDNNDVTAPKILHDRNA